MDVTLGGFPMLASLKQQGDAFKMMFSSGMVWNKGTAFSDAVVATSAEPAKGGIPMSEVQKHKTKDSAWVILHGKVYDLTEFLDDHPGGAEVVLKWAGRDATKFWSAIHKQDWIAEYTKPEWCLGPLGPEPVQSEDSRIKEKDDEIKALKAELARMTTA